MTASQKTLADNAARLDAISVHDRCFLVEAGAGSGKTAVMAGRIALLLAQGIAPRSIAAVTFTEFAASELFIRVRAIVDDLAAGDIPAELRVALPYGLSEDQRCRLAAAREAIDELTCSTIHGFCQRLITPYPVEADIDPGAAVMDRDQADLAFDEIVDDWLRNELDGEASGLLAELVLHGPDTAVRLIRTILDHLRRHRSFVRTEREDLTLFATAFREAVDGFAAFIGNAELEEPETTVIATRFQELAEEIGPSLEADSPSQLVGILVAASHPDLYTQSGSFRKYQKKTKWRKAAQDVGLAQADGDRMNEQASAHYGRCCETWTILQQAAASRVLAGLIPLVQPVMERFRNFKRSAGLLDFDDLIFAARDLLRDHDAVRRALGQVSPTSSSTSFRTPIPSRRRFSGASVADRRTRVTGATGRHLHFVLARCSWWVIPNRRSIASGAQTLRPTSEPARLSAPRRRMASSRLPPTSAPARRSCVT